MPILGLKGNFDLNYNNHRMGDVALNELMCRLIFLIRLLKVDTVVCWDPWAHDEENPDHYMMARAVEAACWMAGRAHDYPEQLRRRADRARRARQVLLRAAARDHARGRHQPGRSTRRSTPIAPTWPRDPAGTNGSRLRAELAKRNLRLPLLGDDDVTADRNYIKEFVLARSRELGTAVRRRVRRGVPLRRTRGDLPGSGSPVEEYIKKNAVPLR